MINQKINPVMGYEGIEVMTTLATSTAGDASAVFRPLAMKAGDTFIGYVVSRDGLVGTDDDDEDGITVTLSADGVQFSSQTTASAIVSRFGVSLASNDILSPATLLTVTASNTNSRSTASGTVGFVAIRIPTSAYTVLNDSSDSVASTSGTLNEIVPVTADYPVFTFSVTEDGDAMSVTELSDTLTWYDQAIYGTTRLMIKSTIPLVSTTQTFTLTTTAGSLSNARALTACALRPT